MGTRRLARDKGTYHGASTMKLSNAERQLLNRSETRDMHGNRVGIMQQIREYPGRVVSVKTAHARVLRGGKSVSEACTVPANTKKNPHGLPFKDDPAFRRDLASDEAARDVAERWGAPKSTIWKYRREMRKCES